MPPRRASDPDRPAPSAERAADRLHSAAIHLLRGLRREDSRAGLSAPRLSALSVVVGGGPLTLGELAAAEQVRPPTMTRLVQALEQLGMVTREVDASDGRVWRIRATAKGRTLLLRSRTRRVEALAARLARLGDDELESVETATAIIEQVVRELAQGG